MSALLVAAPAIWVVIDLAHGVATTSGTWFSDNWRNNVSLTYAEYAVGLFIASAWTGLCLAESMSPSFRQRVRNVR
jgi:hypothetical protein